MRDSLTVLAILVIVFLTTALVAPYFIDWSSHRALIEAKLSEAAGAQVTIDGPIDVRLLPQPVFRLGQVAVATAGPDQPEIRADQVDVEIALTALMRGEVQIVNATLRSPHLDISTLPSGALGLPGRALASPRRVAIQHFAVTNGSLTLSDPGRGAWTFSGIDFAGEATSLLGPLKLNGRFGPPADPQPFHLSTGAFDAGKLRAKLILDGAGTRPQVEFDGTLVSGEAVPSQPGPAASRPKTLPTKTAAASLAGPSFEGTLTAKGSVPVSESQAQVPWSLTSHMIANRDKAAFSELELRAGADMRALIATGEGEAVFDPRGGAKLRLHGSQLSLDTLAVAPDGSSEPAPKGFDLLSRLNGLVSNPRLFESLPFPLDLDYGFDIATAGDLTILDVGGHVHLGGEHLPQFRFAASGPENARVLVEGSLEPGAQPVFRGRLQAGLRDLPRFADRLAGSMPSLAAWIRSTASARAVSLAADVDLSKIGFAARNVNLELDRTKLAGTLSYTSAVGPDRARLFADLSSDALDLDTLPDLGTWVGHWGDLDLQIALAAKAMKVAPAGLGPVDAGRLALRLDRTGGKLKLEELSAELGSARLNATADLDGKAAHLDAHVQAPQLDALADLFDRLWPGRLTGSLKARAADLSPANLTFKLDAARADDGALLPTAVAVQGTANGTRISAQLKPDRPGDIDPVTAPVSVSLTADGAEATTLLRQLGVPISVSGPAAGSAPGSSIGTGRVDVNAHGSMAEGFTATLGATLGEAVLSFSGKAKPELGNGHLSCKGGDLGRLLRPLGLVALGGSEPWPAEAEAELSWHDGHFALRRLSGHLDGVAVSGDLNASLQPPSGSQAAKPTVFGTLQLERLTAAGLFELAFGPTGPAASPASWSNTPFGPALNHLPRTEVAIKVGTFGLAGALEARNASFVLRADNGAVTLADLTGAVSGKGAGPDVPGSIGGTLTLRRDGPVAALSGAVSWGNVPLGVPGLAGRTGGTLDVAGSGVSAAALVTSLAGSGTLRVADGRIDRLDPGAITRTALAEEKNLSQIDADQVRGQLSAELDRGPLVLGNATAPITLAAGVLRVGDLRANGEQWVADTDASLDLRSMSITARTVLRASQPLPDWTSEKPQVVVVLKGPLPAPVRDVDAAAFVNALQSRAIARDQERIDVMQQDIRERAYFNRRLKAIEADQQAARDKAKADAEAARAKAQADARAEAEATRAKAQADLEAAKAREEAEAQAAQAKAKADADAAQAKLKAAAEARAAAEIDRQINIDSSRAPDLSPPKARVGPRASAPGLAPPRDLLPGARVPTIGTRTNVRRGRGSRARGAPSIVQERGSPPVDPSSEGPF